MTNEKKQKALDPRMLMPVREGMFPQHRPGTMTPVDILRYTRATLTELENMLRLFGATSDEHRQFADARDAIHRTANTCMNSYNDGLAEDSGVPEIEAAKQAGREMAKKLIEATAMANARRAAGIDESTPDRPSDDAEENEDEPGGKIIGSIKSEPPKTGGKAGRKKSAKKKSAGSPKRRTAKKSVRKKKGK